MNSGTRSPLKNGLAPTPGDLKKKRGETGKTPRMRGSLRPPHATETRNLNGPSEYNRDQARSLEAIDAALARMGEEKVRVLLGMIEPYLAFRDDLERFHTRHVTGFCTGTCFETRESACCGFESIFTYFADLVIAWLRASGEERGRIRALLAAFNRTLHCVYLTEKGCLFRTSPVSCAMFLCDRAKAALSIEAQGEYAGLREREKEFTRPDKPILFDEIERIFIEAGVDSPHMYCHRLPGLLKLKARWRKENKG